MIKKIGTTIILVLMILNGLLYVSNIYVIGNREAAISMHDDLAPTTSAFMANVKVINVFVVGILYLVAAFGFIRKKHSLTLAGVIGCILFIGLYIIQIILWADIHPRIWIDFSIFGGISILIGIYSGLNWKKRIHPAEII